MVGLDYSKPSIQLAQELVKSQRSCQDIKFEVMDIIRDDPRKQSWWLEGGFDLVLDKGTFDAISLSDEVVHSSASHPPQTDQALARIHTLYPSRALGMVKPGGFLLVTSCNWTQDELINWFTTCETGSDNGISTWKTVEYPKFRFGGQEGQGVCTVCFRKDPTAT
jgi:EEF1A lysine methyltransferase 2